MRDEFVKVLTELAQEDPNLILITGDLGFGVLTEFSKILPNQFINAGVAEQNMTGLAVGLALEGKTVFTYSIGNFPTLRCLEQIRNDACYHQANIKIVAVGGGFSYGSLGISHHATEDLAIMRALPNMTIVAPGDVVEAAEATRKIYQTPGSCYLRLGRGGEPRIHQEKIDFRIGKALNVLKGKKINVISTGGILKNCFGAVQKLQKKGLDIGLYSMHTLKPLDSETIVSLAKSSDLIITVEEHSVIGGLGSGIAEIVSQMPGDKAMLKIIGLQDCFSSKVGDQDYLREAYGIATDNIINSIEQAVISLKQRGALSEVAAGRG